MGLSFFQFKKLHDFLYKKTGIFLREDKLGFLTRRVEDRLSVLGLDSVEDYIRYLGFDSTGRELDHLIELVVINETYFFREYDQLKLFSEEVLPVYLREKGTNKNLRLLSAGCSTGDEAYTLAIILREMVEDFEFWDIKIDAVDISNRVLEIARRAVYTNRSLRETPYLYRDKYFEKLADSYRLKQIVRDMVTLSKVNLYSETEMGRLPCFDIVFCRNVLIYFDLSSAATVLENLYNKMRPGAFIFLGVSESVGRLSGLFELVRFGKHFAYRKS